MSPGCLVIGRNVGPNKAIDLTLSQFDSTYSLQTETKRELAYFEHTFSKLITKNRQHVFNIFRHKFRHEKQHVLECFSSRIYWNLCDKYNTIYQKGNTTIKNTLKNEAYYNALLFDFLERKQVSSFQTDEVHTLTKPIQRKRNCETKRGENSPSDIKIGLIQLLGPVSRFVSSRV